MEHKARLNALKIPPSVPTLLSFLSGNEIGDWGHGGIKLCIRRDILNISGTVSRQLKMTGAVFLILPFQASVFLPRKGEKGALEVAVAVGDATAGSDRSVAFWLGIFLEPVAPSSLVGWSEKYITFITSRML